MPDGQEAITIDQLAEQLTQWFAATSNSTGAISDTPDCDAGEIVDNSISCRALAPGSDARDRNPTAIVVALSGGVDSGVVAAAAARTGRSVVAVTAVGPSVAARESEDASWLCEQLRIRHQRIDPREIDDPAYRVNDARRCFHCKKHLYGELKARYPTSLIVSGTNADDLGDYRPGLLAAAQHQVHAPLAELGISKSQVRQLARHWGLKLSDKPASPCLASRIAHGVEVTAERLRSIEQAELFLRELGFSELRVRLHPDQLARIEVPIKDLPRLLDEDLLTPIVKRLKQLGFRFVTLDLEGFRSGSLHPSELAPHVIQLTVPQ